MRSNEMTRPATTTPDAAAGAEFAERLARLERRVRSFGVRIADTGEDLADTLEQLAAEVFDLQRRTDGGHRDPFDLITGLDKAETTADLDGTDARPGAGLQFPPAAPGLGELYRSVLTVTAEAWYERVVRPTLRRAIVTPPLRPDASSSGTEAIDPR